VPFSAAAFVPSRPLYPGQEATYFRLDGENSACPLLP